MKLIKCTLQPTIKDLVESAKQAIEQYFKLPSIEMGNGKSQVLNFITQIYLAKLQTENAQVKGGV
jgi:hypothetical protein